MGNCKSSNLRTAKLIDSQGILRQIKLPITAAELMLENPGYFVSQTDDLRRTRRFSAMTAVEELRAGIVYMLVPINRLHSKVSESDLALIEPGRRKNGMMTRGSSKVSPEVSGEEVPVRVLEVVDTGFGGHRLANHRRWNPVLETISEC